MSTGNRIINDKANEGGMSDKPAFQNGWLLSRLLVLEHRRYNIIASEMKVAPHYNAIVLIYIFHIVSLIPPNKALLK